MERLDDLGGVRPAASPPAPPAQEAKEQVRNLAQDAKRETARWAGEAGNYVSGLVTQQKDQAAERLGGFAGALRDTANRLQQGNGGATAGRYALRAADQVDRLSHYLRGHDLQTFVRDGEQLARRHPEVFLGGALLAGLALARFLKSSSNREDSSQAAYPGEPFGPGTDFGSPPEPHRTYPGGI